MRLMLTQNHKEKEKVKVKEKKEKKEKRKRKENDSRAARLSEKESAERKNQSVFKVLEKGFRCQKIDKLLNYWYDNYINKKEV